MRSQPTHSFVLQTVERPHATLATYGAGAIEAKTDTANAFVFSDKLLRLVAIPDAEGLRIELFNKSQEPIRVLWDSAVFVDLAGRAHRVVHPVGFVRDRHAPQAPSVVVQQSLLKDKLVPVDHISYSKEREPEWYVKPLVEGSGQIEFHLPIEHEGQAHEYVLIFEAVRLPTPMPK